jgi:hypothetical protein
MREARAVTFPFHFNSQPGGGALGASVGSELKASADASRLDADLPGCQINNHHCWRSLLYRHHY